LLDNSASGYAALDPISDNAPRTVPIFDALQIGVRDRHSKTSHQTHRPRQEHT
jgi:hypothetical protein